jgi:hypothetical protein
MQNTFLTPPRYQQPESTHRRLPDAGGENAKASQKALVGSLATGYLSHKGKIIYDQAGNNLEQYSRGCVGNRGLWLVCILPWQKTLRDGTEWKTEVRYLIENGGTIGESPAAEAMDQGYLEAVFGGDPDLLAKLRSVIAKGMAEDPAMNLGEVAAMVVTYHMNGENRVEDVAAHIIGGFPARTAQARLHRDGFLPASD